MDDKITIEQIKTPDFLVSVKQQLADFLNYNSSKEARDLAYDLEKVLKQNLDFEKTSPDIFKEYQDVIVKLKLIALPFLTEEEIINTLKDHFSIMLLSFPPVTNDIVDKLTAYLVGIPVYDERDVVKGRIMRILLESQEIITTNSIKDETGIEQLPTISNWIKTYLKEAKDTEDSSLKLILFLNNSRSVMSLSDKEKETLKALLSLYEFLRKSSMTPEGLEESILVKEGGTLKIFRKGQLEEVE